MSWIIKDIKESIRLYFLLVTNPRAAWRRLAAIWVNATAKAIGWFVAVAIGFLVGMGIVYAVSEGVDSRTEYRMEQ